MSEQVSSEKCYHWVAPVPECLDGRIPRQLIASPSLRHDEMCCDGCCQYYHCTICGKNYDVDAASGRKL